MAQPLELQWCVPMWATPRKSMVSDMIEQNLSAEAMARFVEGSAGTLVSEVARV